MTGLRSDLGVIRDQFSAQLLCFPLKIMSNKICDQAYITQRRVYRNAHCSKMFHGMFISSYSIIRIEIQPLILFTDARMAPTRAMCIKELFCPPPL